MTNNYWRFDSDDQREVASRAKRWYYYPPALASPTRDAVHRQQSLLLDQWRPEHSEYWTTQRGGPASSSWSPATTCLLGFSSSTLVGFSCGNDREKSGDIVRTWTTDRAYTMASRASKIAAVAREIFGTLPIRGVRTGMQYLKTPLTGAYESRFYMEPIEPIARKVRSKNSLPYLVC